MNKKIFIFLFLIASSPVWAAEDVVKEEVVIEKEPQLENIQYNPAKGETTFMQKIKKMFSSDKKKNKIKKAKEVSAVEPKITDDDVKVQKSEKNTKQKTKKKEKNKLKKQKNKDKNDKKTTIISGAENKNLKADKSESNKNQQEVSAVDDNEKNKTTLINTAYQGSINTSEIISVDNCIKLALEHHPAIHVAMSDAEIYKSRIAQAWANYFPTLSAGLSYSRNDMQMSNFAFPIQKYDMFYVPNISANMLLFDFGKTKAQADIAKSTYESSKHNLQSSINDVIFNCKQAYFNLLFALQQEKVYEDTVKDYELHLEQALAYYNIGTKPKIDVLTAEYNLGNAKLNLIKAKNTVKVAYVQLSNSMGLPEYNNYEVRDNLTMKEYNINVDDAVNKAFETRPDLLAAKKKADASELLVRASRRAFAPDITGFASYTRGGKKLDTDYGYQFGAQLSYSSVNLLLLKKQVDEAKATYKRDLASYENTKQTVYFEVKEAYINLVNAQDSIGVAKLSMDQAKEQYDQASGRYKVGLGDAIELKDAETTYRNSQLSYYSTLLDYHVSAASLERVIGVPLETSDTDLL